MRIDRDIILLQIIYCLWCAESQKGIIIIIIIIIICLVASSVFILFSLRARPAIILSSDAGLPSHNVCTLSTPWGAFQPCRRHFCKCALANLITLAFASYWVPMYLTPGWRMANVDQCLAKGHSAAVGLEPRTLWSTVRWHIHSADSIFYFTECTSESWAMNLFAFCHFCF